MPELEAELARARAWLVEAERVLVLTGAGISTDSGIPDFRGPQGLWTRNPEMEKLATLSHYMGDTEVRKRSWASFLDERGFGGFRADPNPGHLCLVELERRAQLDTLITQNVDGLHQKAGVSPECVVEIHGSMQDVVCMQCGDRGPMEGALVRVRAGEEDPSCKLCGGILKSATISFGQNLVPEDLARCELAAQRCDLLLAVGTSLGVYPAAGVVPIAHAAGAHIVIVNGQPTELDHLAHARLEGSISEWLPRLVAAES